MKRSALAALAALALILTGCSSGTADAPAEGTSGWYAADVTLPDGTKVTCVATSGGGVSCDWPNRSQR